MYARVAAVMRGESGIYVVNGDFGEVVIHLDLNRLVLFEKSFDFFHHIGHHAHNFIQTVAAVNGNQAHIALIYRQKGNRLNGHTGAAAAAEQVFVCIFGRIEHNPELGLYVLAEQVRHFPSNLAIHNK